MKGRRRGNPLPAVAEDDDLEQGSPPGGHGGRVNRPESEPPNTTERNRKGEAPLRLLRLLWLPEMK